MSTAAISESPAPANFLLVRPLTGPAPVPAPTPASNVVPLFGRNTTNRLSQTAGQPASPITPKAGALPRRESNVQSLDPESAERAVVSNMSCKVAQSALEILHGVRSVQQLARWLDARCLSALTTRARLYAQACRDQERRSSNDGYPDNVQMLHRQPRVQSVHCYVVCPGICETTVIVADRTRYRAIAMRLELAKGLWKVTALRIG